MVSLKKRLLILLAVFAAALTVGMAAGKRERKITVTEGTLEAASLPILYAEREGIKLGPLYGYSSPMDSSCCSSLFPFSDDLRLNFHLAAGSRIPEKIGYEVRSQEDDRLIERGTVNKTEGAVSDRVFIVSLQDLLEEGRIYNMRFEVGFGDKTAYYYCHICRQTEKKLSDMLNYAVRMHEDLFDEDKAIVYAAKLEPSDMADKNTLAYVNINSSFSQVSWGDSGARPISDVWVSIQAFEGDFGHFMLSGLAEAATGENTTAQYRVREYISLQMYKDVTYLLRYERHTEEIWRPSADNVLTKGFLLGVQEEDRVDVRTAGSMTAFTVCSELYLYSSEEEQLTKVFSFQSGGEDPLRTLCSDYDIRLLRLSDKGEVDFLVCGYMNGGGSREGSCGLAYYRYDPSDNSLTERMFLNSARPYELLKEDTDRLFYENEDGIFYFCFENRGYVYDYASGEVAVLITQEQYDSLVVGGDGRLLAWVIDGTSVRILNLATGDSYFLEAEPGDYIDTLGYIRSDLILGYGHKDQQTVSTGFGETKPYYQLTILDENSECVMLYAYTGIFETGISGDDEKIVISRCSYQDGSYGYLNDDVMLRSDGTLPAESRDTAAYQSGTLMREVLLPLKGLPSVLRIEMRSTGAVRESSPLVLPNFGTMEPEPRYFAYGKGTLQAVCHEAGEAIAAAAQDYGFVTDSEGRRVWIRREKQDECQLGLDKVTRRHAEEGALNVTGAALRELMYFLDAGSPIYWKSLDLDEQWIIGYEWENAILYDPVKEEIYRLPQEELDTMLAREYNFLWVLKD